MGASSLHPIFVALNELLRSKGLKLKRSTIDQFLGEVDVVAPWFATTGHLNLPYLPSWDKLGRDLDFAFEQGKLKSGVRPVWKPVRSCLGDQRCSEAIENGQAALEMLQEERSEKEASEKVQSEKGKGSKKAKLYPSLPELDESDSPDSNQSGQDSDSEDDEEAIKAVQRAFERVKLCRKERIKGEQDHRCNPTPTAPPPYMEAGGTTGGSSYGHPGGSSFNPAVWREVRTEMITQGGVRMMAAYPVFQYQQGNRYHELLDFKTVKNLAESVRTYVVMASFTVAQVESLTRFDMTPNDWVNLAKACLTSGQYL